MPREYQEVEYIQSSGTQYIDTGVSPTSDTGFTIEYQESSTSGTKTLIGAGTSSAVGYIGISRNGTQLQAYWGNPNNITSYTFTFDTKHKIQFNLNSNRKVVMDGTEIYTLASTPATTITTNTLTLCAFKYTSIVQYANALKLYSCQIYDNGTLIRSYIPCYRVSDNVIGLYDLVNNSFYTNNGTGTFGKGNNVYHNPIELCKIGNYVDKLKRTEGKQLFDKSTATIQSYLKEDGTLQTNTSTDYVTSDFIPVEPNTAYYKTQTLSPRTKLYDINKQPLNTTTYQDLTIGGNAGTFTTPSNAYYFRFTVNVSTANVTLDNTMVSLGTTALPYEPYGNVWYIEKNIGKVVLNGSETWTRTAKGSNYVFWALYTTLGIPVGRYEANSKLCNYFPYEFKVWSQSTVNHLAENSSSSLSLLFNVDTSIATTVEEWNSWLSTHNTTVYYALANPTYEVITNDYLIEQLNNIQEIELVEKLCYVDWVGVEKPTMYLQYGTTDILHAYIITENNKRIRTDWGI